MADRYGPRPPSDPTPIPMHERIRNRREELGLAAHELAKLAGVSPSYISLIESGAKIPSEEVARRIAQALDDNPRVYAAWSHTSRYGEPDRYLEDARDLAALTTDPKARRRLASGEDLDLFRDLDAGERRAPRTYGDPRASRVARARAAKLRVGVSAG